MTYQTPVPIVQMLRELESKTYVLPDIQREFVWGEDQIAELFDSLMRGYPIGTFLFWKLTANEAREFKFYDFVTDYSEFAPHNPLTEVANTPITAVLDGQQRLSAINFALRGSYATRLRYGRRKDPSSYPPRYLHLNILGMNGDAAPDESVYTFSFLTYEDATAANDIATEVFWVPASLAYTFEPSGLEWSDYLQSKGLAENRTARATFHRLMTLIHNELVLVAFDETGNDVDKVLNIFIRVNRGGTKLSYSDLLMSMASAKWVERDARQEVHDLVDTLNATGDGFDLSLDRVLKAALVLCDIPDIKLKTRAMKDHMLAVEDAWDDISASLQTTMQLFAGFGLSATSLRAGNAVIPIAYYVQHRKLSREWLTSNRQEDVADRAEIRSWLLRGLLRAGFWTGAVDPILREARSTIKESGSKHFPRAQLEANIEKSTKTGKSLRFTTDQLEGLLASSYSSPIVAPLLQFMLDRPAERDATHVDHVYPKSLLKRRSIAKALVEKGWPGSQLDDWLEKADQIANLQLLRTGENTSKGAQIPTTWLASLPAPTREMITIGNDLENPPENVGEWFDWFERRRERMRSVLAQLLGVDMGPADGADLITARD
jgi:hypothetical protein